MSTQNLILLLEKLRQSFKDNEKPTLADYMSELLLEFSQDENKCLNNIMNISAKFESVADFTTQETILGTQLAGA